MPEDQTRDYALRVSELLIFVLKLIFSEQVGNRGFAMETYDAIILLGMVSQRNL